MVIEFDLENASHEWIPAQITGLKSPHRRCPQPVNATSTMSSLHGPRRRPKVVGYRSVEIPDSARPSQKYVSHSEAVWLRVCRLRRRQLAWPDNLVNEVRKHH
jgi:hypothetical protein